MNIQRSKEEWENIIEEYRKSNLSIAKYSKSKNIPLSTFTYWLRKFKTPECNKNSFVKINNLIASNEKMKITWKEISIEIPESVSEVNIAKLLKAIKEVC